MRKKPKIIQVPMNEDLLERLNTYSSERGQSRSAFIREACTEYVAKLTEDELVRQYEEGYRRFPEGEEEEAWAKMGEQELAKQLAEDEW